MSGLARRKPLRARPKGKGNGGEREVVDMCHRHGWTGAYRNMQSGGFGGGDIIAGPPDCHLEVKRCESLRMWDWLAQAEGEARPTDLPLVIFRRNRSKWYAVVDAEELFALLKLREA